MRKLLSVFGAVLVCWFASSAQTRQTSDEAALIDLENRWVAALVKTDLTALASIQADSYVDTDEEANRSDRAGEFAVLKSGDLKMTSIKLSDMHVHLYGDFAVVTGAAAQSGAFQKQPVAPRIVFTDSFVRQNGKWLAVSSQRTAVK